MNTVAKEVELPGAFILGAAAAPSRVVGMNAEVQYRPTAVQESRMLYCL